MIIISQNEGIIFNVYQYHRDNLSNPSHLLHCSTDEANETFAHPCSLISDAVKKTKEHSCVFSQFSTLNFCVGVLV